MNRAAMYSITGFLLTVVFIECTVEHVVDSAMRSEYMRSHHGKEIIRSEEDYDVLFLGDSSAIAGINPRVFNSITGKKSFNLAMEAPINAVGDLYLMREYLEQHPPPDALVVMLSPLRWHIKIQWEAVDEFFPDHALNYEYFRGTSGVRSRHISVFLSQLLPSYRHRHFLRNLAHEFFTRGNKELLPFLGEFLDEENLGFRPSTKISSEEDVTKELTYVQNFQTDPEILDLFLHACQLARKNDVPFFLIHSPIQEDALALAILQKIVREVESTLGEALSHERGCTVLSSLPESFPAELMSDAVHLNTEGAKIFTEEIAKVLELL